MNTSIFARLGNAVINFFAFFVKLNPMWAYRFTTLSNEHADKFLLGMDKEIQLIVRLLKKGTDADEIRAHKWSSSTVLSQHHLVARLFSKNFVDYIPTKLQFEAAITNNQPNIAEEACSQSKYTPSEEQILRIANNEKCMFALIKHHLDAFTPALLNKLDAKQQASFVNKVLDINVATPEQVEWALAHPTVANAQFIITRHVMKMPATEQCANMLRKHCPTLFDEWVKTQSAAVLCNCCLKSWAQEKNEQYLRLIEEKAYIHNDSDSAIQLVKSTKKFIFPHAIECVLQQNASEAHLLPYVAEDNRWYQTMVRQILNHSAKIKHLTENQVAKLSDEQRNTYWKNMALCNHISAQQFAKLPDGKLKQEVAKIMEDNAMIAWFQKNQEINEYSLSKFGNRELSERVQHWLAKNSYLAWLVYYFSGSQISETTKIAFGWDWKLQKNDTKHHLSTAAFKKLVDDNRARVIRAYLHVYKNILPEKREYLLCSPLKHLAVGIGTR